MFVRRPAGVPEPPGYERDLPPDHLLRGARHLPAHRAGPSWHLGVAVTMLILKSVFIPIQV